MIRRASIFVLCLIAGAVVAQTLTDRRPPWDALLLASFDRHDATDRSYSARTPTVSSGATFTTRAADFDGTSNAVISWPDADALETFPITVCCWVRIDLYTNFRAIATKITQTGTVTGWRMYHAGGISRGLGFYYGHNGSNYRQTYTAVGTLSASTWYHVAATVAAVNSDPVLYINGSAPSVTSTPAGTVTSPANTEPVRAGALGGSEAGWYVHDGAIDDLRIFSRVLSASEIAALYSSTVGVSRP